MSERGFFAVGIYHGKTEHNIGTLLRSATLYGAAFVFTVGARYQRQASDTCKTPAHTPLFHYRDVDDLIQHLPWSAPLIGVELDPRAVPLSKAAHMERAVYLLGAEDHGLPIDVLDRCHQLIQVDAPREFSLNVSTAGSIVMWDRHVKRSVRSAVSQ